MKRKLIANRFPFSLSYLALVIAGLHEASAQSPAAEQERPWSWSEGSSLPSITVKEPPKRQARPASTLAGSGRQRTTTHNCEVPGTANQSILTPPLRLDQDVRTGTVEGYTNSTSIATKTSAPIVNRLQSPFVVARELIQDQAFLGVTNVTRYIPGVAIHQAEGHRDGLVIHRMDSSTNFFVNGFRDDVQIFRDLDNSQSLEVLQGPMALQVPNRST